MTTLRRLELGLHAWRSFRGIARASRTLAAAQAMHWAEHARRVDGHLRWCAAVAQSYGVRPQPDGPRAVVAIGTDLGLCGPLNPRVADAVRAATSPEDSLIVVGERLAVELPEHLDAATLPAPSSFAAVEALAAELDVLLSSAGERPLRVVLCSGVEPDGKPMVEVFDDVPQPDPLGDSVDLTPPAPARIEADRLLRHARLASALTRAATSESEARWRAMSRAHDAADRRIDEQERTVRRMRQESITQEMLEVRRGRRS